MKGTLCLQDAFYFLGCIINCGYKVSLYIHKHMKALEESNKYNQTILYIKATCMSVCVGSAWKILLGSAHTHRHCNCPGLAPHAAPPLWTGVVCCFYMDRERAASKGGSTWVGGGQQGGARKRTERGGGQHGRGRTNGCIMHRVHTSFFKRVLIMHNAKPNN